MPSRTQQPFYLKFYTPPIKKPLPEILFSDSGPTIQLLTSRNI
jgi:hypothetical protein